MEKSPLRIIHITDTHIAAKPNAKICGIDSYLSLESILKFVREDIWIPELVIATGDLSDDGSPVSYQRLRALLMSLEIPVYCIPGNHDDLAVMNAHLKSDRVYIERALKLDTWNIILLNSQVPHESHGYLNADEFTALDEIIQEDAGKHALVCLHHGPLSQCSMSICHLKNSEEFLSRLTCYSSVRGVISGHTHCAVDKQYDDIRILVTPSTFVYAEHPMMPHIPAERSFGDVHTFDTQRRGFRRLELYPDGTITTEIVWDPRQEIAAFEIY